MRLPNLETLPPLILEEVEALRLVRESLQVQMSLSLERFQWLVMERSVWKNAISTRPDKRQAIGGNKRKQNSSSFRPPPDD